MPDVPRRTAVAHPRTFAVRRKRPRSPRAEVTEQTTVGNVLIEAHIRAQLRLGLLIGTLVGAVMLGIPLLLLALPALRENTILDLSIGWIALSVLVFPVIVGGGIAYLKLAERNEDRFTQLMDTQLMDRQ